MRQVHAGRPTGNRVDVSEYLDPGEGQPRLELTTGRRSMDDPLALGIVSAAEARTLVDLFHQHLNPPLALLDPTYHTLTFMHETSCALLTAVMAASAKFFHGPEVYRLLLDHAQVLINRAVAQGHCEIGMIQCLMVLSHFKETRDRSAWIKIGMALRFAYQNGLHKALQEVDGPQGEDARAQLNLERTWFCLNCFDSTYSNLFLLPLTIPSHQRGDVDKFLKTCAQLHALKVNPTTKAYRAVILTQLLSEVDRHQDKWFTGRLSRLAEHEETSLRISQFSQGLTVRMMLIDDDIDTALHLAQGLAVGSTVVGWVESIATHGNFLYCQDTTSVHLARLVVFFHNFFRRFASAQQSLAVDLMKRLNTACLSVPNMGTEGAPAFVARLIQRVLRSLSTRSMVPSRAASPSLAQPELSEAVMTGLDEFLATITAPELSTGDGQYW
ncbi:hypothetical protein CspHIS471_0300030 [Cutaneotrichosporon sp. HIS471]|nr:hypothetical protein CspHIS471_0300030 [Cutaneotrichosporon sp. HIS471]